MRILVWLLRAFVFFTLFAFALNNTQEAGVRWFFGHEWRAPMVIIVLVAFAAGCVIGVLAMVPAWWRHRQQVRRRGATAPAATSTTFGSESASSQLPSDIGPPHSPRDGL